MKLNVVNGYDSINEIYDNLEKIRKRRDITGLTLSKLVGGSDRAYSIIRSSKRNLYITTILKYKAALECSILQILPHDDDTDLIVQLIDTVNYLFSDVEDRKEIYLQLIKNTMQLADKDPTEIIDTELMAKNKVLNKYKKIKDLN